MMTVAQASGWKPRNFAHVQSLSQTLFQKKGSILTPVVKADIITLQNEAALSNNSYVSTKAAPQARYSLTTARDSKPAAALLIYVNNLISRTSEAARLP
jgi:hypothetical protein